MGWEVLRVSDGRRRYRFGPLERRGLIGGLGPLHLATLLAGGGATLGLLATARSGYGVVAAFLVAGVTAGLVFWPVAGRPVIEWLPVVGRFRAREARGHNTWRSTQPTDGTPLRAESTVAEGDRPPGLHGIRLVDVAFRGGQVGVIHDHHGDLLTAVLGVRVGSFSLLGAAEQEQRLAGWGGVLAALSREGSPVSRVQWIERTSPGRGDEVNHHFATGWDRESATADSFAVRAYVELIAAAPAVTRDHELLLAVQVDPRRVPRQKRPKGRNAWLPGGCELLLREVEFLAERLTQADVEVAGLLRPQAVANAIKQRAIGVNLGIDQLFPRNWRGPSNWPSK